MRVLPLLSLLSASACVLLGVGRVSADEVTTTSAPGVTTTSSSYPPSYPPSYPSSYPTGGYPTDPSYPSTPSYPSYPSYPTKKSDPGVIEVSSTASSYVDTDLVRVVLVIDVKKYQPGCDPNAPSHYYPTAGVKMAKVVDPNPSDINATATAQTTTTGGAATGAPVYYPPTTPSYPPTYPPKCVYPTPYEQDQLQVDVSNAVAAASTKLIKYLKSNSYVTHIVSDGIRIVALYDYGCGSMSYGTYNPSKCDYNNPHLIGFQGTVRITFEVTLAYAVEVTTAALTSYGADRIESLTNVASDSVILVGENLSITQATKDAIYKAKTAAAAVAYLSDKYKYDSGKYAELILIELVCTSYTYVPPPGFYNYLSSPMSSMAGGVQATGSNYPMWPAMITGTSVAVPITCTLRVKIEDKY